jgi:solute:Na+ symporter, SSS family
VIYRVLDITVIVVYFGGITLAGIWFARRNRNTEDYFLGGRNFPGWAIGLSMVGTSISSISFMAYPGDAYKTAWLRVIPCFTLPIAIFIASIWFLPFYRRSPITSAYEYLEKRFGPWTRFYAALIFLVGQAMRLGTVLFLLSLLIHELFPVLPVEVCIILGGVFVSFYTVAGGIEAVVWTDVVQTVVLTLGGLVCLIYICWRLPGGLAQIFETAIADGKLKVAEAYVNESVPFQGENTAWSDILTFDRVSWKFSLWQKTGLMMLFMGLNAWIAEYSCNQNVVQRYCASKSAKEARKAMWICCFSSVPIWTWFMFLGTAMYVFFKFFPDEKAYGILIGSEGQAAEQILPFFVLNYLPVGIGGLVVAAVLAAAMSSLDSSINAISTVFITDIYRRHMQKEAGENHYLSMARAVAIVASVLMILIAIWFNSIERKTFQDTGIILAALMGGGLLGIFMLGFFVPWGDGRAIFCGIVFTTVYTAWMGLQKLEWIARPEIWWLRTDDYYTGFLANVIMFLAGFAVGGFFTRKRDLTNLTVWTQDKTPLQ